MEQMSFFSAEAEGPKLADLAGVLCGQGQIATFAGTAARLSVVLERQWRASLLAEEFARCGVQTEVCPADFSEGEHTLVRTSFRADLLELAGRFSRGAMKSLPPDFRLDGGMLRLWALACGQARERGYVLVLDRRAPDTHEPLRTALAALGLGGSLVGPRAGGPGVRITGRRRLAGFAELVGEPPTGADSVWPGTRSATLVG